MRLRYALLCFESTLEIHHDAAAQVPSGSLRGTASILDGGGSIAGLAAVVGMLLCLYLALSLLGLFLGMHCRHGLDRKRQCAAVCVLSIHRHSVQCSVFIFDIVVDVSSAVGEGEGTGRTGTGSEISSDVYGL